MVRAPTPLSRTAAVLVLGLALLQLQHAVRSADAPYVRGMVAVAGVVGVLAAVKLWRDNCFESRLVAVILVGCTVLGEGLAVTMGLPGSPVAPLTAYGVGAVVLGLGALLLLAVDRPRPLSVEGRVRPYAP